MAANLSPELANRLAAYFSGPDAPGNYIDPVTHQTFQRAENPLMQGYSFMERFPGRAGTGAGMLEPQYDASGHFVANRPRPKYGFMNKMIASGMPALAIVAAPFAAAALGAGAAGAGAAGAGASELAGAGALDFTMGGAGGAAAFTPATAAEMGSMGLGGLEASGAAGLGAGATDFTMGGGGTAFNPATAGEMGSMGLGSTGTATMGAGAPMAFNPAADSQLANEAIQAGGGDALSGYTAAGIPSVTVNGAPGAGGLSGLGSGISSLFGHSGTNTIGDAGGFNWGSLIGPAINGIGGIASANAAKSAADSQLQAAREAQAKLEPWYQAGGNALNRLQEMLGIGGNAGAADYGSAAKDFTAADFQADPGYAFRQSEGEKGLQRAASASGGLGSGKYLKDAMSFNSGLASQEYGNSWNRFQTGRANKLAPYQSLAGQGQTAAGTVADLSTQAGNARAAGQVGSANAISNALTQGVSAYQNNQQMDQNRLFQNALMNRWAGG